MLYFFRSTDNIIFWRENIAEGSLLFIKMLQVYIVKVKSARRKRLCRLSDRNSVLLYFTTVFYRYHIHQTYPDHVVFFDDFED